MKPSCRIAWALVLLLAGLPALAEQRTLAVAALAQEPGLKARALDVWWALDAEARREPRYLHVELARRGLSDEATREDSARQARLASAAAWEAYGQLDIPRALEKVELALRHLEASDLSRNFRELLDGLALKAFLLDARKDRAASALLGRLFTLAPRYRLDASRMNPRFIALAEKVREQVLAAPRGSLRVDPPGANAWVFVDGAYQGTSPLQVDGLPVGAHHVTLLAPGFELVQSVVTVERGATAALAPKLTSGAVGWELEARLARLATDLRQGTFAAPASELRAWTEADELLVVVLGQGEHGPQATLLRVAADGQHLLAHVPAGPETRPEALARAAFELLDRSFQEPASAQARGSGSRRLWGYASLGAGAAAALGGVLVGQMAQRQAQQARAVPQLDEAGYRQAAATARGTALVADGLFVAALAGLGVGGWMLFTGEEAPARKAPGELQLSMAPLRKGGAVMLSGGF